MAVKQQRAGVWLACMVVLSASCAHAWTGYSYSSPPPPPCYTKSSPPPPPPCHSPPPPPPPPSPSPPPPPPPPSPSPPPPPVPVTIQAPPPPSGYSYQPPPPPPCYTKSSPPPPPVGYSYQPPPPPPCNTPPPQCGMLALTYSPDLSIVASLIKAAGPDVVAAFSNDSLPFTLLAPVNSAFAGVDIQKLIADNRSLRYILGYHILWPYPLPHNLLQINGLTVNTLSGTKVQLKASAGYNGVVSASACTPKSEAHFILPRYSACKIVIQPINSLLKY